MMKLIITETGAAVEVVCVVYGRRRQGVEERTRKQLRQIIQQVLYDHPRATVDCDMAEALRRGYWSADLGCEEFTVRVLEPEQTEAIDTSVIEVAVEGGLIDEVKTPAGVEVIVRDYDTDGMDEDRMEHDREGRRCLVSHWRGGAS
ncbi:MAG: hypothetical protein WD042_11505 [Phycisphaeraceae bacterium]